MPQLLLDAQPAGKQALREGKASDDVTCQRKLCIASASSGRLAGVTNFDFSSLSCGPKTSQANHKPWHSQASVQLGWVTVGSKGRRYNTQQLHWKGSSKRIQRRRLRAQEISGEWSSVLRFSSSDGNSGNQSIGLKAYECFCVIMFYRFFLPHVRHSYFVLFLSFCVQDLFHCIVTKSQTHIAFPA